MGNMMGNKDDTEQFDYTAELMKQKVRVVWCLAKSSLAADSFACAQNMRSVEVKLGADEKMPADCGVPRRHINFPEKLINAPYDGVTTVWAAFLRGRTREQLASNALCPLFSLLTDLTNTGLEKFPNNNAYGIRRPPAAADQPPTFFWITYRQAHEQIKEIALGLKALGQLASF